VENYTKLKQRQQGI